MPRFGTSVISDWPGATDGADLDVLGPDDAVDRRADHRVAHPVLGGLDLRLQRAGLGVRRVGLGLGGRDPVRVVALGQPALRGRELALLGADPGRGGAGRRDGRGVARLRLRDGGLRGGDVVERGLVLRLRLRLRGALRVELLRGDVAGAHQRGVAVEVGVGARQRGPRGGHLRLRDLELSLRLADRRSRGVGLLLGGLGLGLRVLDRRLGRGDAAGALGRLGRDLGPGQRDVGLGGPRLRALGAQARLGLLQRGALVGVVEPDDDLALVDGLVGVDQDLAHPLLDLARHRHGVGVDPRVVGGLVRGRVGQVADAEDQRGDHHDRDDDEDQDRRAAAALGRCSLVAGGRRRRAPAAVGLDGPLLRRCFGAGFHGYALAPFKKMSTMASRVGRSGTGLSQSLRPTMYEKNRPRK